MTKDDDDKFCLAAAVELDVKVRPVVVWPAGLPRKDELDVRRAELAVPALTEEVTDDVAALSRADETTELPLIEELEALVLREVALLVALIEDVAVDVTAFSLLFPPGSRDAACPVPLLALEEGEELPAWPNRRVSEENSEILSSL